MLLNKLITLPTANSREMRAYMAALLEVSGMMSGQGFALKTVLGNISTHLSPKVNFPHPTLQQGEHGLIYITADGLKFFSSRLTTTPIIAGQYVKRSEIVEMIRRIVSTNAAAGWEKINAATEEDFS